MNFTVRKTVLVAMVAIGLSICLSMSCAVYAADPKGYEVVAENERLVLFLNSSTTEIAVRDKATGEIWYSNPPSARQEKYQLNIVYYDPEDKRKRMDNYKDSVGHGQFEIQPIENGVAISYTLGQLYKEDDFIPLTVSQGRFQSMILDRIDDPRDQSFILDQFELVELHSVPEPDTSGSLGPDKLWGKYELVSPVRTLRTTERNNLVFLMLDRLVDLRDDVEERADVKEEYLSQLLDNPTYILKARITPWDKSDMVTLFKSIGYLPEDVGVDQEAYSIPAPEVNVETFDITVEYTLDDDSLIVTLPMDKVRYPKDVVAQLAYVKGAESVFQGQVGRDNIYKYFTPEGGNLVTFPLYSVNVLPFFGAAEKETQGYIFVPDGSGALIDIATLSDRAYLKRVFGKDYVIPEQTDSTDIIMFDSSEFIHLPVFGFKKGDLALFSVIESGASFASVSGRVAGSANNFSSVSSEYILMPFSVVTLATTARSETGGDKSINVYAERLPSEDIRVRYVFLDRESADYVGMARYYQQYLVDRGILKRTTREGDPPLFLDLIGGITKRRPIMGVPFTVPVALTTFSEAREIVDELMVAGVKDMVVKYSGWLRGGVDHDFPSRAMAEGVLGGPKGLMDLRDYLNERNVELFPSVYFQMISLLAESVNLRREAAKMPTGEIAQMLLLSPGRLEILISDFLKDYLDFDIGRIALDDMGYLLSSDFQPGRMIDRSEAVRIVESQLKRLRDEAGLDIMLTLANVYALPYGKYMIHIPMEATRYQSVAESVPFLQMVVRGFYTYAGGAINLSDNITKTVLRSIEVGACPQFRLFYRDPSIVKDTNNAALYSCNYEDWLHVAVDIYLELEEFLKKVKDQRIVDHKQLAEDVYQTVFENGVSVIVNYGSDPFEVNGLEIEGVSYRVIEGGQSGAD